jgi:hypothetical protein
MRAAHADAADAGAAEITQGEVKNEKQKPRETFEKVSHFPTFNTCGLRPVNTGARGERQSARVRLSETEYQMRKSLVASRAGRVRLNL